MASDKHYEGLYINSFVYDLHPWSTQNSMICSIVIWALVFERHAMGYWEI